MAARIIKDEHGVTQWVECVHGCGEWWRAGESIFLHYQTKHVLDGVSANVVSVVGVVMAHPDLTFKVVNEDLAIIQRHLRFAKRMSCENTADVANFAA